MAKKRKKAAKKSAKKAASGARVARVELNDDAKIKVIGEHSRREGSRYHGGYERMKKITTVGAFIKARSSEGDGPELLRAAVREGYISISGGTAAA